MRAHHRGRPCQMMPLECASAFTLACCTVLLDRGRRDGVSVLGSRAASLRSEIDQRPVAKNVGVPLTGKRKLDNPPRNRLIGGANPIKLTQRRLRHLKREPHDPRRLGIEFSIFQVCPDGHLRDAQPRALGAEPYPNSCIPQA